MKKEVNRKRLIWQKVNLVLVMVVTGLMLVARHVGGDKGPMFELAATIVFGLLVVSFTLQLSLMRDKKI